MGVLMADGCPALLGGVVWTGPVTATTLRSMAGRVNPSPAFAWSEREPAGLFATGRAGLEMDEATWIAADTDLLNLPELYARAGVEPGRSGLLGRLYAMDGPDFVRHLRGAFAVAVWDRRRRRLMLAVDHFGIRRLYYEIDGRGAAFASRVSAMVAVPGQMRTVDLAVVYRYLNFGFVPAPETMLAGIHRLPPGHALQVGPGHARVEPFWDMRYPEEALREERAVSTTYRLTHQAVREAVQQIAPKEVGAYLSGGTDSSTVVGLMTRITGEPVNTFSIGFNEDRYDELRYAEITARHFGAVHHTQIVTAEDALAALPTLVSGYDEPLGNNSALGTLFCARLARQHGVTHLLAGDGGDEIFGGNERYRTDQIFARYERIPSPLRRLLEPTLRALPADMPGVIGKAQRYVRRARIPNPRRFYSYEFHMAQHASEMLAQTFLEKCESEGLWRVLESHFGRAEARSELNRLMYLDLKLTIGDNDLFKVTRTADLAGVGVRFPFLSLPLVEFTGTLPASMKVRGREKRYLFRRTFRSLLPPETLAKRKHGFGVPTAEWLRRHRGTAEMARDVLLSPRTAQRGYFARGALERLFAQHVAEGETPFYGDILWNVLMLELWHRRYVDGREEC